MRRENLWSKQQNSLSRKIFSRNSAEKITNRSTVVRIRLSRLLNSSPMTSLKNAPKVKQDAQAYASASHPVIDYNKNVRS